MNGGSRQNLDEAIREQMVAYLDGELAPAERQRLDNLVAANPDLGQELQKLDATWEMLNELPRATVGESFTTSTVEMVALSASRELEVQQLSSKRHKIRQTVVAAIGIGVAGMVGFIVMLWLPSENDELIKDYHVINNLEEYMLVQDIRFLERLAESGVFAGEPDDAS